MSRGTYKEFKEWIKTVTDAWDYSISDPRCTAYWDAVFHNVDYHLWESIKVNAFREYDRFPSIKQFIKIVAMVKADENRKAKNVGGGILSDLDQWKAEHAQETKLVNHHAMLMMEWKQREPDQFAALVAKHQSIWPESLTFGRKNFGTNWMLSILFDFKSDTRRFLERSLKKGLCDPDQVQAELALLSDQGFNGWLSTFTEAKTGTYAANNMHLTRIK